MWTLKGTAFGAQNALSERSVPHGSSTNAADLLMGRGWNAPLPFRTRSILKHLAGGGDVGGDLAPERLRIGEPALVAEALNRGDF